MVKVCIVGGAGGIGQPLALLCKLNPKVTELALFDVAPLVKGVAVDLSHIDTSAKTVGFAPSSRTDTSALKTALTGANVVLIPAGVPRKPGMTRDDLFKINAGIVQNIAQASAEACPNAFIGIISNPVNSTVPIFCEVFKKAGVKTSKIFGITTLDVLRANTFVGEAAGIAPTAISVPVVGGHSGTTILPLISQAQPAVKLPQEKIAALTDRIQNAGTEVVDAKGGGGSATLSMAQAASRFGTALIRAASGETVQEYAFVPCSIVPECAYFATPVLIGPNGLEKVLGIGKLSAFEEQKLKEALPALKDNIKTGITFVSKL